MQLLYLGFTQEANMRCYRFEGVVPKDRLVPKVLKIGFSLKADMALLAVHRIRFQDVPGLCLDILAQRLNIPEDVPRYASYDVTNADLTEYISAKSTIEANKPPRRRPRTHFKPAESSQLKWPVTS